MSQFIAIPIFISRSYRRIAIGFIAAALIPLLGYLILYATSGFYVEPAPRAVLRVTGTRPGDGERSVAPNGFVAADVHLPNSGHGVDARTVSPQSVRLFRSIDSVQ